MNSRKLTNVVLHITDACTSHCPYCYACSREKEYKHADIDVLYKIIDKLADAKIERVSLLGGDPALHPHIVEIAEYLNKSGIAVALMSNTMNLPVSLEEASKYIDLFETTIHGSDSSTHDSFCNKEGSYNLLIQNLKKLSSLNVKIGVAINIIPQNATSIFDMLYSLVNNENINISYVILQRIIPFGRAENSSQYVLTKENIDNALQDVFLIHEKLGIEITVEDPFPLCIIDDHYRKFMHPCEWGYTKAALNGEGDLTRCGADPRYLLGNIFETPILDIWENSPILQEFREKNHLPYICKNCEMLDACGGGCPLSNETDKDAGVDYLLTKYRKHID